jgi:predicted transcriptional regulator
MTEFINGVQAKVLSHITNEWQSTIDISRWCNFGRCQASRKLNELHRAGLIMSKWDTELGKKYWKLTEKENVK